MKRSALHHSARTWAIDFFLNWDSQSNSSDINQLMSLLSLTMAIHINQWYGSNQPNTRAIINGMPLEPLRLATIEPCAHWFYWLIYACLIGIWTIYKVIAL